MHRDRVRALAEAKEGERGLFLVRIAKVGAFARGRLHILRLQLEDGTAKAQLYLFNRPYLLKDFRAGRALLIHDVPERSNAGIRFGGQAGTTEMVTDEDLAAFEAGRVLVYYKATTVIPQPRARALAAAAVASLLDAVEDPLPEPVRTGRKLVGLRDALRQAHGPESWGDWDAARRRLVFDQLYLLQVALGVHRRALARIRKGRRYELKGERLGKFRASLPFNLTGAQDRVTAEIFADLARAAPMNRLLQGDVGSGKTAVAAAAIAAAADSGLQAAVLAPTEILAEQHLRTFEALLGPAGIRVGLLTGGLSAAGRRSVHAGLEGTDADLLESRSIDLVVGTHALLESKVVIPRLGLAVIDERHKFGVRQRAALERKGKHPDLLMMTATPLPRAVVLTQYGDTALSLLDEMPPGRGTVTTTWAHGAMPRDAAYKFAMERLKAGERAFAVFPLVEESEKVNLRDATQEHERLQRVFAGFAVGLIHGRMNSEEKAAVMQGFATGAVKLLVSTTVVEVGLDIPDATIMLIEHANRFGLAQLHQLRGRIGRRGNASWCFLITNGIVTADARARLGAMVRTRNGFELAETDLRIRGPGELFGTRQAGLPDEEVADLLLDPEALEAARREAEALLEADPNLGSADGAKVKRALEGRLSEFWGMARFS